MAAERIGAAVLTLSTETGAFYSDLDKVEKRAGGLEKSFQGAAGGLQGIGKSLVSVGTSMLAPMLAVGSLTAAFSKVLDFSSDLTDLAGKTGMTTTALQQLQYVLGQSGISAEQAANAAVKMGRALVEGDQGAAGAVKALRLNVNELIAMGPDRAFLTIGEAIAKVPNPMQQAALATQIFGKAGADLLPGFSTNMREVAAAALASGAIIGEDLVAAGDAADAAITRMKASGMAILAQVILPLTPAVELLADWVGQNLPKALQDGRDAFNYLLEKGLEFKIWLVDLGVSIVETINEVPVLGKVFGQSAANVNALKTEAQHARDTLDAFRRQGVKPATDEVRAGAPVLGKFGAAAKDAAKELKEAEKAAAAFKKSVEGLTGVSALEDAEKALKLLAAAGGPANVLPSQMKKLADTFNDAAEAARLLGKTDLAEQYALLAKTLTPVVQFQQRFNVTIGQYVPIGNAAAEATEALWEQFYRLTGQVQQIQPALKSSMDVMAHLWDGFKVPVTENGPGAQIGQEMIDGVKGALGDIPNLLTQAFTGGGGIGGAFQAIGTQITSAIVTPALKGFNAMQTGAVTAGAGAAGAIGSAFGATAATVGSIAGSIGGAVLATTALGTAAASGVGAAVALGAATAGIGLAAVGAYVGIKKLFSLSKERKEMREDIKNVEDAIIDTLTASQKAAAGGERWAEVLIGVRDAFLATGRSAADAERLVAQMWDERNPERAKEAIALIGQAFNDLAEQQRVLAEGTAEADTIFEDLFATAELMGNTMPDALRPMIDQLVQLGVVGEETAAKLAGISAEGNVDFKKMESTAKEFGIEVGLLGDKFQGARLAEDAQKLWNGFQLLTKGGTDANVVMNGMRDEITGLVRDSIKFGTAIPENFRPWIEQLQASGGLVDENGVKLADLSGLKFGPPIVDQWQVITDKLSILIDKISIALPKAINAIPDPMIKVHVDDSELRELEHNVDMNHIDITPMAAGGFGTVDDPTLFLAGEGGPEEFAFSGANKRFAVPSRGLGGSDISLSQLREALQQTFRSEFDAMRRVMAITLRDAAAGAV